MTAVLPASAAPPAAAVAPPLAGWWRRVASALLDDVVLAAVTWLGFGGGPAASLHPPLGVVTGAPRVDAVPSWAGAAVAVTLAAFVLLQACTGATPGKRVAGVAVVRSDTGAPAGLVRTVARPFLHLLDAVLLIGYVRPLWHRRGRTFADSLLGTVAVETRRPPLLPWLRRLLPGSRAGSVAVDAAAAVVCVAGVVLAFPTTSSGGTTIVGDPVACAVEVPGGAPDVGATAVLQPLRLGHAEQRAWVVRDLEPSGRALDVAWSWTGSLGNGATEAWSEVRVSRAGGGRDDALLVEGPHAATVPGPGTFSLSVRAEELAVLEPGGWVESSLVVDGAPLATCRLPGSAVLGS